MLGDAGDGDMLAKRACAEMLLMARDWENRQVYLTRVILCV